MATLKELREKQEQLAAEARSKLDEITTDMDEGRQAEINEQADRIFAEFDRLEERAQREERAAEMAARLNAPDPRRPVGEARSASGREQRGETTETAFRSYLAHGINGISPEQRAKLIEARAMSVGSATAGGYAVPTGFMAELIKSLKDYSPMLDPGVTRELVTASGETINMPSLDDTSVKAVIVGENAEVTTPGDLTLGQKTLRAYKYTTGIIKVSRELAQDSAINLETEIRTAMAERLGRGVGDHLTDGAGNGSSQPWGIVTRSTLGVENALSGGAGAVRFDDLIDLEHSIDPAYRRQPSTGWMFADSTLKELRKIKDGDGNFIWQPASFNTGAPATISGYRYTINPEMAAIALSAKPVLFGAMNRYVVRRVAELSILRLEERYAEFGQIAFIGFARFDGELLDTAAVKHLAIPAA